LEDNFKLHKEPKNRILLFLFFGFILSVFLLVELLEN